MGLYLNTNVIDDVKKFKLFKHSWIKINNYEFPFSQNE